LVLSSSLCSFHPFFRGLSLAFIKPENAMQSPSDNEATDRCYCRSNGNGRRGIVGTSWQAFIFFSGLVRWRRWIMFFETTSFRSLTDMVNFNLPSELLTFNNWTLIHGKSFFF
jgi:hypothetical protein